MRRVGRRARHTKVCTCCFKEKAAKCFNRDRTKQDGLHAWCSECSAACHTNRKARSPELDIFMRARHAAFYKGKNLEFTISLSDIVIPERCPVFGFKLGPRCAGGDRAPSLDRIDPTKGYVPGNVRVVSWKANRLKGNLTLDQVRAILSYMERHT